MRNVVQGLGALLFHLGRLLISAPGGIVSAILDAVYGPPVMAPATRYASASRPTAGDFARTVSMAAVAQRVAPPAAIDKESMGLVLRAAGAVNPATQPEVSKRVHLAEVVGPGGLLYGVMWLYLYPDQGFAKRVFKVTDRKLAKSLRNDRYFMDSVPFDPKIGSSAIMEQMHKEVSKLLDRRPSVARDKRTEMPPMTDKKPAPAPAPVVAPVAVPARQQAQPAAAPAKPPAYVHRKVDGEVHEGIVAVAGTTTRNPGTPGAYDTFCLTLNDGRREVPLYGTELERQVRDLKIELGERVKVVFMGRANADVPGKGGAFKNLYQVMRIPT